MSFRQLLLPELSVKSQVKMKKTRGVLIVGAGGLGCPAAMYLAAAGVGRIGIVDHDVVDISNLNRQVLHFEDSVGVMPKAVSVKNYLASLNSGIECEARLYFCATFAWFLGKFCLLENCFLSTPRQMPQTITNIPDAFRRF